MADIELSTKGLDDLIKSFKVLPIGKIGVLGDSGARNSGEKTNAEIGLKHEFGNDGMPVRSFLRVPIAEHLSQYLSASGAFNKSVTDKVIENRRIFSWMKKVMLVAETVVQDAFQTGGFGKWPAHKPGYTNNTGMILVDTQQLRNSISSRVEEQK